MGNQANKTVHKRTGTRKTAAGMRTAQHPAYKQASRDTVRAHSRTSHDLAFIVKVLAAVAGLVLFALVVDYALNFGKAYEGVHVGSVDVSGMTAEQITQAIDDNYASFTEGKAVVYATQEAATNVEDKAANEQDRALAEQLAVDEAAQNQEAWPVDAASLEAYVPSAELAEQAINVGRSNGGFWGRVSALFSGCTVDVYGAYNDALLDSYASSISEVLGDLREDWGVSIADGVASVTEGHDGTMFNTSVLKQKLDAAFFEGGQASNIIAEMSSAPVRITQDEATKFCDSLNQLLSTQISFTYVGKTWALPASTFGTWIDVQTVRLGDSWQLTASIDEDSAKASLSEQLLALDDASQLTISFDNSDKSNITVHASGKSNMPNAAAALEALTRDCFNDDGSIKLSDENIQIEVEQTELPETLSFSDALNMGVIGEISSFTTEFTTGEGTENRNHNIALVSELLNNSVCSSKGTWSYNGTSGNCDESKGFLGAGAIVGDEYIDSIGGGICQVATTVFNAVYVAGYPINERHNHSLYISSYPQGRDAAVSYPDLDLRWTNDTQCDVLVQVNCGDGEVTCTLYGVDPEYQVTSDVGDWEKGETYSTKTTIDDSLSPGVSYIKTSGTDGRTITVVRTVCDTQGNILHEDTFQSVYNPKNEVIVKGPDS